MTGENLSLSFWGESKYSFLCVRMSYMTVGRYMLLLLFPSISLIIERRVYMDVE